VSAKTLDEKQKKDKLILRCIPFSDWAGRMWLAFLMGVMSIIVALD
jgi:hypothetical protein